MIILGHLDNHDSTLGGKMDFGWWNESFWPNANTGTNDDLEKMEFIDQYLLNITRHFEIVGIQ